MTELTIVATNEVTGEASDPFVTTLPVLPPSVGVTHWHVAPDGDDTAEGTADFPFRSPQEAVLRALPGDVIYLRGGVYDSSHGDEFIANISGSRGVRSGEPGAVITLRNYPGERPEITELDGVRINNISFWRIEGLAINGGHIGINERYSSNTHDIWIIGNEVYNYAFGPGGAALRSNPGVIKVDATGPASGSTFGAYNIFIEDNLVHDFTPDGVPWDQADAEHNGAFNIISCTWPRDSEHPCQTGLVEIRNNTVYNVPSFSYVKLSPSNTVVFEGNTIHHVQELGRWSPRHLVFERNIVYDVRSRTGARLRPNVRTSRVRFNTFVDMDQIFRLYGPVEGHEWTDNVFFGLVGTGPNGPSYVNIDPRNPDPLLAPFPANQNDRNCFITPDPNFIAHSNQGGGATLTLAAMQAMLGLEINSSVLIESDKTRVFADPDNGDFTLIGEAASQCSGRGA